jgi:hypothetical protein
MVSLPDQMQKRHDLTSIHARIIALSMVQENPGICQNK